MILDAICFIAKIDQIEQVVASMGTHLHVNPYLMTSGLVLLHLELN